MSEPKETPNDLLTTGKISSSEILPSGFDVSELKEALKEHDSPKYGTNYEYAFTTQETVNLHRICCAARRLLAAIEKALHGNAAVSEKEKQFKKALESIASLGIYCCDDESLGHECEAVRIAREALGLDIYLNRWGEK